MWSDVAPGASWFDVAFGMSCAAVAGRVGWSFVGPAGGSSRWWGTFIVAVGVAAVLVGALVSPTLSPAITWFTAAALVLAGVDGALLRLPNALVYPTVVIVATWLPVAAIVLATPETAVRVLSAGVAAAVVHLALHAVSPSGLGMGDVKFAPAIAMVMAWDSWGWVLVAALVPFLLAATWGIVWKLMRRQAHVLPFGPFMVAGAAVTPVVGDPLLRWWL